MKPSSSKSSNDQPSEPLGSASVPGQSVILTRRDLLFSLLTGLVICGIVGLIVMATTYHHIKALAPTPVEEARKIDTVFNWWIGRGAGYQNKI